MEEKRLYYLLQRNSEGTITFSEREELYQWFSKIEEDERAFMLPEEEKPAMTAEMLEAFRRNYIKKEPEGKIKEPEGKITASLKRTRLYPGRWAAAAAVIGFTASLFLVHKKVSIPAMAAAGAHENKIARHAILTLGDGQKIQLDSQKTGKLAGGNGMEIVKLDSSSVAYKGVTNDNSYNTLTTPRGVTYQVVLPDASKVWLDAESSLRYPVSFNGSSREVELTGEGYFEVRRDPKRPFIVRAGRQLIEDLGTAFNINAYGDEPEMQTTLINGAVRIGGKVLKPGQQALSKDENIVVKEADIQKVLAWQRGVFEFDNTSLQAILRQISRWYDIKIVYVHPVSAMELGGSIQKKSSLADVLKFLEDSGVNFKVERGIVYVNP